MNNQSDSPINWLLTQAQDFRKRVKTQLDTDKEYVRLGYYGDDNSMAVQFVAQAFIKAAELLESEAAVFKKMIEDRDNV